MKLFCASHRAARTGPPAPPTLPTTMPLLFTAYASPGLVFLFGVGSCTDRAALEWRSGRIVPIALAPPATWPLSLIPLAPELNKLGGDWINSKPLDCR